MVIVLFNEQYSCSSFFSPALQGRVDQNAFFLFYTFLADWVAVGFSDRGELTDADFCVFWVDWKEGAQVQVSTSTLFLGIFIAT